MPSMALAALTHCTCSAPHGICFDFIALAFTLTALTQDTYDSHRE